MRDHTDCYFTKSKEAAEAVNHNPVCLWQVFQKNTAVFAGLGFIERYFLKDAIEVWAAKDGQKILPWEPALLIKARFQDFVEYETEYLGIIARCTMVATNVRKVVDAANGKPVLFFPARFDVPETQHYDGYAAYVGGAAGCATHVQTVGFDFARRRMLGFTPDNFIKPVGTMPHALIAAFGGDTAAACLAFAQARPNEDVWALVDYHNDCARTAVECFKAMKDKGLKLHGVRLDTSEKLVDKGIADNPGQYNGVCPALVHHVRQALNEVGAQDVKIGVSGGFSASKVELFESLKVPVDVYAVGESFIRGSNAFTSDIVARFDGSKMILGGKVGRSLKTTNELTCIKGDLNAVVGK